MSIEQEFFKRKRPIFEKLEGAGFLRESGRAVYRETFFEDQFEAEITVSGDGGVSGKVTDLDTGEEYLPIRVKDYAGGFVGALRESYAELLGRIAEACFTSVNFSYDQANRIALAIERTYGAKAEFPWDRYPGNGTFKRQDNGKWFAAILTVERYKLTPAEAGATEEIVDVINLKAVPEEIPAIIKRPGIYNGWHMNKKHWISVTLDDTLTDDDIMALIDESWNLTAGKAAGKVNGDAWIIPSNPAMYDVDAGFAKTGEIEWHQHNNIKPDDEVYIYSAAPNSAILYRCLVTAVDLGYHGMFKGREGYDRSMRIRLIERYPKEKFPLSFMKEHGGSAIRGARRMPAELLEAMKREEKR